MLARRALTLSIACQRGCKVLVSATLSPAGRRGSVALVAAAQALPRATAVHVRLRVGPLGLRRLRKALGRSSSMTARVQHRRRRADRPAHDR